jgi:murein DD-endopeptidase MepM/ murein hydrolase activator NlpD
VRAAANGIAATVQPNPNLGWTVVIQHTTDLFTAYTNLQDLRISSGERVSQGQVLGLSGSAALIPPDTIWFTVRINDTPINPAVLY